MFEVAYETTFCATHRLTEDGRPLEPLHGHDWRVEAVAAGESLDRIGVVVDFEHLKKAVGEVAARFHYRDINEHPAFAGVSPSAEVVARYLPPRPKEVFLFGAKDGTDMAAVLADTAVALSVALQHGVPAQAMAASIGRAALWIWSALVVVFRTVGYLIPSCSR